MVTWSTLEQLPPLARSRLDRAAHRRTDEFWLAEAYEHAQVVLVDVAHGAQTLIRDVDGGAELVFFDARSAPPAAPGERLFLGVDTDGTPVFALAALLPELPGTHPANLRDVGDLLSDRDAGIFTTAVALGHWHARSAYSPANGQPTVAAGGGWTRVDPVGRQHWPRTDPAIIVLVHDGEPGLDGRCLLGHNAAWAGVPGWGAGPAGQSPTRAAAGQGVAGIPAAQQEPPGQRFSCLAGFVEAGESAEAAVVREVAEEVGVLVDRISYVASQAWPFPCSLMLGFLAYADPAQPVHTDQEEIVEARWFTRREIAAVLAGEPVRAGTGGRVGLPMPSSIAYYLIKKWLRVAS